MLSEIEKTKITFSRALTFRELCWIIILRNCFILWLSLKHITHFTRTSDSVAHYTIKNSLLKNFYAICVCEFVWPPVSFGRDYSCYLINIFSWENLHFEAGWFCIYTYTCVCVCVCVCIHIYIQFCSVQLLSPVWIFATPWMVARQVPWFIANSRRLLKLMSF